MVKPEIPVDFSIQKDDDESVLCDLTFLAKEKYEDIELIKMDYLIIFPMRLQRVPVYILCCQMQKYH